LKILYFAKISEELGKNQELLVIKGKLRIIDVINILKKKNKKYNLVRKKIISYLKSKKIKYDYIENFNITNFKTTNTLNKKSRIFIAFYINKIRLIDNY